MVTASIAGQNWHIQIKSWQSTHTAHTGYITGLKQRYRTVIDAISCKQQRCMDWQISQGFEKCMGKKFMECDRKITCWNSTWESVTKWWAQFHKKKWCVTKYNRHHGDCIILPALHKIIDNFEQTCRGTLRYRMSAWVHTPQSQHCKSACTFLTILLRQFLTTI